MKFLCLFIVAFPLSTTAQIRSGTVIFFQFTKTELVLAADSRVGVIEPNGDISHNDDQCKIAAVDGKIIIAIAGVSRVETPVELDFLDAARTVGHGVTINTLDDLMAVAGKWAKVITPVLERVAQTDPRWYDFPAPNGILTTIVFIATDQHGNIAVSSADVLRLPRNAAQATEVVERGFPYSGEPFAMHATTGFGHYVISELWAATTDRAKAQASLANRIQFAKTKADMEFTTLQFCLLASTWFPEYVGGPIDQIYLGPHGIKWLHRKKECPGN